MQCSPAGMRGSSHRRVFHGIAGANPVDTPAVAALFPCDHPCAHFARTRPMMLRHQQPSERSNIESWRTPTLIDGDAPQRPMVYPPTESDGREPIGAARATHVSFCGNVATPASNTNFCKFRGSVGRTNPHHFLRYFSSCSTRRSAMRRLV